MLSHLRRKISGSNPYGQQHDAFAFGGAGQQEELLKADGIEVVNGKVDLKVYSMKF